MAHLELQLDHGSSTDVGLVRSVNEDSLLVAPPLFAVADGMGGHHGGDVASGIVVEELGRLSVEGLDTRSAARAVQDGLVACQARIAEYAAAQGSPGRAWYAGTTAVACVLVHDDEDGPGWLVANLGDSRAYLAEHGRLSRVTTDHSLVQELVDAGRITPEQAATHPDRNVITRALGGGGVPAPDFFRVPARAGVRLMLCSDGICGMIDDAGIGRLLAEASAAQEAADRLVAEALAAGGHDNATAVVVDVLAR